MNRVPLKISLRKLVCLLFVGASLALGSCKDDGAAKGKSPKGYDINNPQVIKLPTELDEISGLAFYPKDTAVFAIVDEIGYLYKIFLQRPKQIEKWRFAGPDDYEDLALIDSNFYVLVSKGQIAAFRFISTDTLAFEKYPLAAIGKGNEFETLYYDADLQKLVMICKDCEVDNKSSLTGFTFNPLDQKYDHTPFTIDVDRIAAMAGEDKMKFKPSAAAINPISGEVFIVSSVNKLLVIADREGKAREVYHLDEGLFKQPEGIAFEPDGTMIISNEAAGQGVANLLIFPYNKTFIKNK
jgi:uncharacterized protein YjiK